MNGEPVTNGPELAAVWPEVVVRVERALRRRGIGRDVAQDIVQEVAVRAFQRIVKGRGFATERDLLRWSYRVARNLRIDMARTEGRLEYRSVDTPTADVADVVQWRDLLALTVEAFAALPSDQQEAIRALLADRFPDDKKDQVRESVRRMRAREQLRRIVGRLPVAWPFRRLRPFRWLVAPAAVVGGLTCSAVVTATLAAQAQTAEVATIAGVASSPSVQVVTTTSAPLVAPVPPLAARRQHPVAQRDPPQGTGHVPVVALSNPLGGKLEVGA